MAAVPSTAPRGEFPHLAHSRDHHNVFCAVERTSAICITPYRFPGAFWPFSHAPARCSLLGQSPEPCSIEARAGTLPNFQHIAATLKCQQCLVEKQSKRTSEELVLNAGGSAFISIKVLAHRSSTVGT
jgi:hypothetical protein